MLVKLLRLNQNQLYKYIINHIPKGFSIYHDKGKYLYIVHKDTKDIKLPLLTSHLDTVDEGVASFKHKDIVIDDNVLSLASDKGKAYCLGGDDRCGVWLMLELLKSNPKDYKFLFTFDEETGGKGGTEFVNSKYFDENFYSCYVSLDRRSPKGTQEVASYGYDNDNLFDIFYRHGYQFGIGSFTDCVTLSEASELACVNLSVGYDNEHTPNEVVYLDSMYNTLETLQKQDVIESLRATTYNYFTRLNEWGINNGFMDNEDDDYIPVNTFKEVTCEFCGAHELLYNVNGFQLCVSCGADELAPYYN